MGCDRCFFFFFFFYNPGLMQSHNSFVSLGCVQFVNPWCRRAIKMVRHGPCQSKAKTGVEFQLRQGRTAVLGQFASASWGLVSWSGRWEDPKPGLQADDWMRCPVWQYLSHTSWRYFPLLLVLKAPTSCIFPFCLKDQYDIWCFKKFKYMFCCSSKVTFQK